MEKMAECIGCGEEIELSVGEIPPVEFSDKRVLCKECFEKIYDAINTKKRGGRYKIR